MNQIAIFVVVLAFFFWWFERTSHPPMHRVPVRLMSWREHASDHVRMTDLTAALNEVLAATEETEQAWLEVTDIL